MNAYKPGTVAVATVRGVPNVRIVRGDGHWAIAANTDDFIMDRNSDGLVTDVRPLVVLDPEDREQTARLADLFCEARWCHIKGGDSDECDPLTRSSMREALAAYLAPPKPAEPRGLGAVVEDAEGRLWIKSGASDLHDNWRSLGADKWTAYDDIDAVRVLSEGVSDV